MSKMGWCSLCHNKKVGALNNAIANGKGFIRCAREMEAIDLKFSKGTFLRHREHSTSPLLTAAETARKNPVIAPRNNQAVLEMIRDLAAQRALENPEEVTVAHGLRAAKILQDAAGKQENVLVIFAKALMGEPPPFMIEGEWKEITTEEEFVNGS